MATRNETSRRIRAKLPTILSLLEAGMGVTAACKAGGLNGGTLRQWIERSAQGEVDPVYAERFIKAAGRPCDRCNTRRIPWHMVVRPERYLNQDIVLYFCPDGCELKWDMEDDDPPEARGDNPNTSNTLIWETDDDDSP